MTRMKLFYIDKDGTCYRTVEFNGDGYCTKPDDNGWIGLQHLIKWKFDINDMEKSFKDMMCVFNREAYGYPEDELDFYITRTCSGEELYKTIKHSYTDYVYIRNDGPDIETPAGIVKTGITVFNYSSLYNSKSIEQCITEAKDSEPYETITVEIPDELYKLLEEAGKKEGMTAEEYGSKILTESIENGTFEKVLKNIKEQGHD